MLDLKELRRDVEAVRQALALRGMQFDVNLWQTLEARRKVLQIESEDLQSRRNQGAKKIGQAKAKSEDIAPLMQEMTDVNTQLQSREQELESVQTDIQNFVLALPNIPDASVPKGRSEDDNVEIKKWGTPREPHNLDHLAIAERFKSGRLNGIDPEHGAMITGARFTVLSGKVAHLQRALSQFMLDMHTTKHGYTEVNVPFIVHGDALVGTGQLPKFAEDLFKLEHDKPWYLIPTAEVPVTNLIRNALLEPAELPLKWVAHTPCFRSEAGAHGKDTRGLIRQHQFEKVELVHVVQPDQGLIALEELVQHAERILEALELPYRRIVLCTGDMGFSATKTYDLEVWLPAQGCYREISSCSHCGDFQARRLSARTRLPSQKATQYVHTLNGSGLALGRTLVALLENHVQDNGAIAIPKALQPYIDCEVLEP
ncbi:MAG: serine--tRNA ligase [Pseudomonadota bacterium]